MHLPDQLTATIIAKTNSQPVASARALYDLDGNLADTFVVATEPGLWVCSRRLGEPFAAQSWPWADVTALAVHAESVFAHLTWTTPDPITYGTVLSSNQLNAAANVPGGFA